MNEIIKQFNDISIDFLTQTSEIVGCSYLYKYKNRYIYHYDNKKRFN